MSEGNTFHQQTTQNISSEPFGSIPNRSEQVGTVPNLSEELEKVEKYSLTVREVSRMFEEAGVPRTERSIVKWCSPNAHGVPRLMCQYEPNKRRWLITEESVRIAIAEEIARQRDVEARNAQAAEHPTPGEGNTEQTREEARQEGANERVFERTAFEGEATAPEKDKIIRDLEYKLRDMEIASRAKDQVINQMQDQHMHLLDQVAMWSRQVGVLETRLLQIEGPKQRHEDTPSSVHAYRITDVPNGSEQHKTLRYGKGSKGAKQSTVSI